MTDLSAEEEAWVEQNAAHIPLLDEAGARHVSWLLSRPSDSSGGERSDSDREASVMPAHEADATRETRRRIDLLERENEALRRAVVCLAEANRSTD